VGGWTLDAMRVDDVPAVTGIEIESFANPWPPGAFLEEIRNAHARCLVARPEGEPAASRGTVDGYVCYWVLGDEVLINNIAVRADRRGLGLGRQLLRHALSDGRASGCRAAYLEVRPSNEAAIRLYRSHGFETIMRRKGYYSDTREDALVMRATLKAPETG